MPLYTCAGPLDIFCLLVEYTFGNIFLATMGVLLGLAVLGMTMKMSRYSLFLYLLFAAAIYVILLLGAPVIFLFIIAAIYFFRGLIKTLLKFVPE